MGKSLNDILKDLGYTTAPSQYPHKKRIFKDDKLIDSMSSGEVWNYLRHEHPEVFEGVEH